MVDGVSSEEVLLGRRMGEGDFPPELDHLNWSTVLWGGCWLLVYGAWRWILSLIGLVVVGVGVNIVVRRMPGVHVAFAAALAVAYQVGFYTLIISLAYRANRHVWERERVRIERQSDQSVPRRGVLVTQYQTSQRTWAMIGLAFLALQVAANFFPAGRAEIFAQQLASVAVKVLIVMGLYLFERRAAQSSRS